MITFNMDNVYFKWDNSLKGKTVIVADSLYSLKGKVEHGSTEYTKVTWDEEDLYFLDENNVQWHYAYPITKTYVILSINGFVYTTEPVDNHVFAVFNSAYEAAKWCIEHAKFVGVARAWLNGKEIQFRSKKTEDWTTITDSRWELEYEYRVKPANTTEEFKVGKVYRNEKIGITAMCIAIEDGDIMSGCIGKQWVNKDDFVDWYEVEV